MLEVLVNDGLAAHAAETGSYLDARLRELATRQPLIASVRGRGLMMGVELAPAVSPLTNGLTGGLANRLARTHFSGLVLLTLRQQHGVMTSYTLHDSNVIRLQPPLIIDRGHVDRFVDSLDATLCSLANFPMAVARSWRIIRRAARAGYAPSSSS
jgi:4-aminobutyrate aminotransferase-like enzyme